jgi:hypothetical protein
VRRLWMLIGTSGAAGHAINAGVARVLPGSAGRVARRFPVGLVLASLILAVMLLRVLLLAAPLILVVTVDVQGVASVEDGHGAEVRGLVGDQYIETFRDLDHDGVKVAGEEGIAWRYFLIDGLGSTGIELVSSHPPDEMVARQLAIRGVVTRGNPPAPNEPVDRNVPSLLAGDLPFRLTGDTLWQDSTGPEISQLPQGIVLFGGLAVLLAAGAAAGYLPFRPSATGSVSPALAGPFDVRLTGVVDDGPAPRQVRALPSVARIAAGPDGQPRLVVRLPGGEPLLVAPAGTPVALGESLSMGEVRYAIQLAGRHGPVVIGFDAHGDREVIAHGPTGQAT